MRGHVDGQQTMFLAFNTEKNPRKPPTRWLDMKQLNL